MKPSILRQWYLKFLEITWIAHPTWMCKCEYCRDWRETKLTPYDPNWGDIDERK